MPQSKHYQQLTPEGRGEIKVYLNAGKSQADIARLINRSRSTISREIKRGAIRQRNSDYLFSPNTLRTRAAYSR